MFSDAALRDDLNRMSTVAGLDGFAFLDRDKTWVLSGWSAASLAEGDRTRMINLQSDAQHYLQRPDAVHDRIDSSATSFAGYAGRVVLVKQKGNLFVNSAFGVIDPRFDNTDLGFLWRSGVINAHAGVGYQWTEPTEWFRSAQALAALFQTTDFDGDLIWRGLYGQGSIQLLNYYQLRVDYAYNPRTVNPTRARGGPLTMNWSGYQFDEEITTDVRKDVDLDISSFMYSDRETSWNVYATLDWKPSRSISISVGPGFERNVDFVGWVGSFVDPAATQTYGSRYVFALLNQTTLSANIRLNWDVHPGAQPPALCPAADLGGRVQELPRACKAAVVRVHAVRDGRVNNIAQRRDVHRRPRGGARHGVLVRRPRLQPEVVPGKCRAPLGIPSRLHAVRGVDADPLSVRRHRGFPVQSFGRADLEHPSRQHLHGQVELLVEQVNPQSRGAAS